MNNKTEEKGVSILNLRLNNYPFLRTNFLINDKTMAIDGWIYLVKNNSSKLEDVEGQMWAQIKSHDTRNKSVKETNKITVSKDDLNYFLNNNGCMYFVVFSGSKAWTDHSIYYYPFTPFESKRILKEMEEKGTKTKTITFKSFPEKDDDVELIFRDFVFKSEQEKGFVKYELQKIDDVVWNESTEIILPFLGNHPEDIFKYQEVSYLQAYIKRDGSEVQIPIDYKVKIQEISSEADLKIKVNDTIYYAEVTRILDKDQQLKLRFGNAFTLTFNKNNANFNYEQPEFLHDDILARKFLVDLAKNKQLLVNEIPIRFEEELNEKIDLQTNERIVETYKTISDFMKISKIKKPLIIKNISNKQLQQLLEIASSYLDNKTSIDDEDSKQAWITRFKISNLTIFMLVSGKEKEFIQSLYSKQYIVASQEDDGSRINNTVFSLLTPKDWLEIDNIDYDFIENQLFNTGIPGEIINHVHLNLLNAFDLSPNLDKAKELLDFAMRVSNSLMERDEVEDYVHLINFYQTKIRLGNFSEDDKANLYEILDEKEGLDDTIKFGLYVLIGTKKLAIKYLKKLLIIPRSQDHQYPYRVHQANR